MDKIRIQYGNEIRLAAKTNIWADTADDVTLLKAMQPGDAVVTEKLVAG